ncbi:MAG: hypothetical protein GY869_31715, partial [Planctomycetes bacterium]|nr:hypothetical protein [Planctomycetota bacterium]
MRKTQFYKILFLTVFWMFAALYFMFQEAVALDFKPYNVISDYNFARTIIIGVIVTGLVGAAIATFEVMYLNGLLRKKAFGVTLFIKSCFYLINMFIFISLAVLITKSYELDKSIIAPEVIDVTVAFVLGPRMSMAMVSWGLVVMAALFILQVSDKFGQGVLVNFLLGKYHQPKEEERIFMFLDLKSSTTYAEKLGHLRYSRLIQDCFFDITEVILRHDAVIYQYVGDEVILSWPL